MKRIFQRELTAIRIEDLDPNPQLAHLVTVYGGINTTQKLTVDQYKRLLYQVWLIRRLPL